MFSVKNVLMRQYNYKLLRRNSTFESYLSVEDVPHPTSMPVLGTKLNFMFTGSDSRLHEYIDRRHKKLGPIFRETLGGSSELVFISDPDLMKALFLSLEGKYPAHILPDPWLLYERLYGRKRGLLFMDGEEWLTYRRIMNKHLLKEGVETWIENPIQEAIKVFIQKWKSTAEVGPFTPDLESEFYRLSTDVIINILLGSESLIKVGKHYEELLALFSETVKNIFTTTTKLQSYGLPVNWMHWLNLKSWRDFKECVDLSLLLAQKIVAEVLNKKHESNGLVAKLCSENMSDEMITKIIGDFVIAAGDTTAYTTLWILHMLSRNNLENQYTTGDTHIKNVVKESMRLYPVAPFLTRVLPKDSMLGPYKLEQGTPVIASIYTAGRDDKNFSRANEFLPYRWDRSDPRKKALENHVPSASLPFALGVRSCIGKKIAMMQLTEVVSQISKNFELKCLNKTEIRPVMSQVLVPDQQIQLQISLKK